MTRPYTLSITFSLVTDNTTFCVTNVYAPTQAQDKALFLPELIDLDPADDTPWIIMGDFNLIRHPHDKNNENFSSSEAAMFNNAIHSLALLEIPLVDRAYTWYNKRDQSTLVRLDRVFVNLAWDSIFPNMALSTLTRLTSDRAPLVTMVSTSIPRPNCFRFDKSWLLYDSYRNLIPPAWLSVQHSEPGKRIVSRLKACRHVSKRWRHSRRPAAQREMT